ncbi:MAG: peptidoglycan DD-metalloendopeptidase family protein [Spirochaetota bacterium]
MSARHIRRCAAAVALLLATAPLPAWQWPVPVVDLSMTFGQDAGGYLLRGVEIGGGAQPVHPVEAGVVIASHAEVSDVPSGLGSYVVVEHEQAFRSIYAHLDATFLPEVGRRVDVDSEIGIVGESGQVSGRALRLYIVDLETGAFVNPMLLLPDLPDDTRPTIGAVFARSGDSLYDLRRTTSLPPGRYELTVEVWDRLVPASGAPRLAPHSLRMFAGGQEAFYVAMDRIAVTPQASRAEPGGLAADDLYGVEGLVRLGTVVVGSGSTEIELVALDFAGNETSVRLSIAGQANEDVQ